MNFREYMREILLEDARTIDIPIRTVNEINDWVLSVEDDVLHDNIPQTKDFKLNTEFWLYDKTYFGLLKGIDLNKVPEFAKKVLSGIITVTVFYIQDKRVGGWFDEKDCTLHVGVAYWKNKEAIHDTIEHEMGHYVQFLFSVFEETEEFGMPNKKIKTPLFAQNKQVEDNTITVPADAYHTLDDKEMETNLISAIRPFERDAARIFDDEEYCENEESVKKFRYLYEKYKTRKAIIQHFLQWYVGAIKVDPDILHMMTVFYLHLRQPSESFMKLKKHAKLKWREVVKKSYGVVDIPFKRK